MTANDAGWPDLLGELDAWGAAGRTAALWWRDDDAGAPHPALDRLLEIGRKLAVPLAMAVIPSKARMGLVNGRENVMVVQHGYAHRNHAPSGERKAEFGAGRSLEARLDEIRAGRERLENLFDGRFSPVFVPPWNRIAPDIVPLLSQAGIRGLSGFAARATPQPASGLRQANTHIDPIDWRRDKRFAGEAAVLGQAVRHLRGRREGLIDADEPTGLLTHHRRIDDAGWTFLERFFETTRHHPAVHWLSVGEVFGDAGAGE